MHCVPGRWTDRDLAPSQIIAQTSSRGSLRTYLRKMKRKMQNVLQRLWCSHLTCEGRGEAWSECLEPLTNSCLHTWWRSRMNGPIKDGLLGRVDNSWNSRRWVYYVGATTEQMGSHNEHNHVWNNWVWHHRQSKVCWIKRSHLLFRRICRWNQAFVVSQLDLTEKNQFVINSLNTLFLRFLLMQYLVWAFCMLLCCNFIFRHVKKRK